MPHPEVQGKDDHGESCFVCGACNHAARLTLLAAPPALGWLQFDCGVHVGRSGDDRRPYLDSDEVDMEDIDILFIRCVRAWPQAAHEA